MVNLTIFKFIQKIVISMNLNKVITSETIIKHKMKNILILGKYEQLKNEVIKHIETRKDVHKIYKVIRTDIT